MKRPFEVSGTSFPVDLFRGKRFSPGQDHPLTRWYTASEIPLLDFTATTIMERFQNASASESVERVLKKISTKKAEEIMKAREPKLPSTTFVSSYLGAFRPREFQRRSRLCTEQ